MRNLTRLAITCMAFLLLMLSIASAYPYANQVYSAARPSYYGQYNYKNSFAYLGANYYSANAFGRGGQPFYYTPYRGSRPYIMSSTSCNVLAGCRSVANSYMYIDSALDYAYYSDPSLLAPRGMDNHQRWVRGLYPDRFYY
jgi:hypothetical protein